MKPSARIVISFTLCLALLALWPHRLKAQTAVPGQTLSVSETEKALLGIWEGEMTAQGRTMKMGFRFLLDDKTLRASLINPRGEKNPFDQVTINKDGTIILSAGDDSRSITFEGTFKPEGLAGKMTQKDGSNAMEAMWSAQKSTAGNQPTTVSSEKLVTEAGGLLNKRDYDGALKVLGESLDIHPKSLPALLLRGKAYTYRGSNRAVSKSLQEGMTDLYNAVGDYSNALKLDADNTAALNGRGHAYELMGGYNATMAIATSDEEKKKQAGKWMADAINNYTMQIVVAPKDFAGHYGRGRVYLKKLQTLGGTPEDVAHVILNATTAIELAPERPELYKLRAEGYKRLKQNEKSDADFKKAEELAAKSPGQKSPN